MREATTIRFGATKSALSEDDQSGFMHEQEWIADFRVDRGWQANTSPGYVGDVNVDGRTDTISFDGVPVEVVFALGAE